MSALMIRHKVADYVTWKSLFDEDRFARRANGCMHEQLFRNTTDPNEILILMAWDDAERARLFANSDDLEEALMRSGLTDQPDWWVLEEMD